jgi:hypothetical protein
VASERGEAQTEILRYYGVEDRGIDPDCIAEERKESLYQRR